MRKLTKRVHQQYLTPAGPRLLDFVRMQFVPPGPEEHVRQDVLLSLVEDYGYPRVSLRSEEPVARGTSNRTRADVLVELPAGLINSAKFDLVNPVAAPVPPHVSYSEQLEAVRVAIGDLPSLKLVELPNHIQVEVNGTPVSCKVIGVVALEGGHALSCVPDDEARARFELPPRLLLQLNGYAQTTEELRLARSLGFDAFEWSTPASEELLQRIADRIPEHWHRLGDALSVDGMTGWFAAFFGTPVPEAGVLCWVDTSALPLPEATGDEENDSAAEEEAAEPVSDDESHRTLMVVECKGPGVALTEEVVKQGAAYAQTRSASLLVVTNGAVSRVFSVERNGSRRGVDDLPHYTSFLSGLPVQVPLLETEACADPLTSSCSDASIGFHARSRSWAVGIDTPRHLWRPILALDDLLTSPAPLFTAPKSLIGVRLLKDLGVSEHEVGNPAGGRYGGLYRDLLIELRSGETAMCGLCVFSQAKSIGHKLWGNRTSASTLLVALSFDAEYRPALQYRLGEESIRLCDNEWRFSHDGRTTVGKGGVSSARVIDFIRERQPELVRDGVVDLGALPTRMPITPAATTDFISRLVAYAVLREAFKETIRAERGTGPRR